MKDETDGKWPSRDGEGEARGLPGYPKQGDPVSPQGGHDTSGSEVPFDPDSPDVTDPQIDPPHPPEVPGGDVSTERRAPGKQYPPYSKP